MHQLGEVEKRFGLLSRQCAAVKQAHEKLERNGAATQANTQQLGRLLLYLTLSMISWMPGTLAVDVAIKRNEALTSAKAKQEATLASLQKVLSDHNTVCLLRSRF